jgi:predicted nucleic acid-binding protein
LRFVADRFVVVLDANVLFPFRKRDVLLSFYAAGMFRARWSQEILDEWVRNLLEMKPHLKDSVNSQLVAMQEHFPESLVQNFEPLIASLTLPDPKDRHVLAAAIKCGAQHIVTENLRDFPQAILEPIGIEAIDADEFLSRTFELYPGEAIGVLRKVREGYRNPPYSQSAFLMDLTARGLPKLASRARQLKNLL